MKAAAERWAKLTEEDKKPYEQMYENDVYRYEYEI